MLPWRSFLLALAVVVLFACRSRVDPAQEPATPAPTALAPPSLEHAVQLPAFDALAPRRASPDPLPLAQASASRPPEAPRRLPKLIDVQPTGETSTWPTIRLVFDHPMVPLGHFPPVDAGALGWSIEPPIAGELRWADPRTLEFAPAEELPRAHVWRVRTSGTLPSPSGEHVRVAADFSFSTTPYGVELTMGAPWGGDAEDLPRVHWKQAVFVQAERGVRLDLLPRHLEARATTPDGKSVRVPLVVRKLPRNSRDRDDTYEYEHEREVRMILPRETWPVGSRVVVTIDGSLPTRGVLPIDSPARVEFDVDAGLEITEVSCWNQEFADGCGVGPVQVHFSRPVPRSQLRGLEITPHVRGYEVGPGFYDLDEQRGVQTAAVWGDFRSGQEFTLHAESLRDIHGQPLAAPFAKTLQFVDAPVFVTLRPARGTIDPGREHSFGIDARHLETAILRVAPLDVPTYARLAREETLSEVPWPAGVVVREIPLRPLGMSAWSSQPVDLRTLLGDHRGPVLAEVAPGRIHPSAHGRPLPAPARALYQMSGLTVRGIASLPRSMARVTKLSDQSSVRGATLRRWTGTASQELGKTDERGMLELAAMAQWPRDVTLEVAHGGDRLVLDLSELDFARDRRHRALRPGETPIAEITAERGAYRPGEQVHVTGWTAIATPHTDVGLRTVPRDTPVELVLQNRAGERVHVQRTRVTSAGKFWASLSIPETARLGHHEVHAHLLGADAKTTLLVEDYRIPEFEVSARAEPAEVHHGEQVWITSTASYYFGSDVPLRHQTTRIDCHASPYRPPGLDATWRVGWGAGTPRQTPPRTIEQSEPGQGTTSIAIPAEAGNDDRPYACTASVVLRDASAQAVGAETSFAIHPRFYVAVQQPTSGDAPHVAPVRVRTVDLSGAPAAADVAVKLTRHHSVAKYRLRDGKRHFDGWEQRSKVVARCRAAVREGSPEATCDARNLEEGSYTVEVTATRQGASYVATTQTSFWVHRPPRTSPSASPEAGAEVRLDLASTDLHVGDHVQAVVSAPFASGEGELVLAAGGVRALHPFQLADGVAHIPLVVDESWVPAAKLEVTLPEVGSKHETARLHRDTLRVEVPTEHRALVVAVDTPKESSPGAKIPIEITVYDPRGAPVSAHVTLWAVDEAVLALRRFTLPNLLQRFAEERAPGIHPFDSFGALMRHFKQTVDPYDPYVWNELGLRGIGMGVGAGFGGRGSGSTGLGGIGTIGRPPATVSRARFETVPIYVGDVTTDEHGHARLDASLPDNLTTFRLTAIASAGVDARNVVGRFGSGGTSLRVTQSLLVRPILPRVLRRGDEAELAVLVQNREGPAGEVDVSLDIVGGTRHLTRTSAGQIRVAVTRGGQARATFRVRAMDLGTTEIHVHARHRGTSARDDVRLPLPIQPEPTTLERVAVYGDFADARPAVLPLRLPWADTVQSAHGGLTVSMSNTLLGDLQDAAQYLVEYPHGCVEQTSSRMLPLIALGDLEGLFPGMVPDAGAFLQAGVARLRSMQLQGGGFTYWPGDDQVAPYASAFATWVLVQAHRAGAAVPEDMLDEALDDLQRRVTAWQALQAPPRDTDLTIALALHALADAGRLPNGSAAPFEGLLARRTTLPVFARAFLLAALHRTHPSDARVGEITRELLAVVDERNDSARVETTSPPWRAFFDSDERNTALVLLALLDVDPEHRLVGKLARGLLQARERGRWSNTQENAYALLAMARYAKLREGDTPDFDASLWLGRDMLLREHFSGRRHTERRREVPMSELLAARGPTSHDPTLVLDKRGPGRLYYRVGLDWAPTGPTTVAAHGLTLERRLRGTRGRTWAEGVGLGEAFAVDLELQTASELSFVAFEVPLPAGVEGINTALGHGTAATGALGGPASWVTHEEIRADRVMIYADTIPPGKHQTTILVRATTPGTFTWPATRAEMMYYPEVYGHTASSQLVVHGP